MPDLGHPTLQKHFPTLSRWYRWLRHASASGIRRLFGLCHRTVALAAKLPRVRFTVRRLMAVVAVVAVSLGAVQMKQRYDLIQRCIAYHRVMEDYSRLLADNPAAPIGLCGNIGFGVPSLASDPCRSMYVSGGAPSRTQYLADAVFHAQIKQHYESLRW